MASPYQQLSELPVAEPFDRVLEIDDGTGSITHFPLRGESVVIGRSEGVDLRLNRPSVSRRHAQLGCDRFGRWWIKDLGSSNGTKVNGFTVSERVLELADRVQLGEFAITFAMPQKRLDESSLHGVESVPVQETQAVPTPMSKIQEASSQRPRIDASHLSQLMALSTKLQTTDRLSERLRLLCELMVDPSFRGEAAVIVRLSKKDMSRPPQTLCPPQRKEGAASRSLYIANSVLAALRERIEPMVAPPEPGRGDEGEPLAALACPLRSDEENADVLYILLPQPCANEEWLTLASMAAEHFRQAETAWAARHMAKVSALVEVDLERARDIQLRLVPRNVQVPGLDVAIGFEPCRWVAGDYVDVLPLPENRTMLIVADVCGKGMPAALVSSSMHTLVHASLAAGSDLASMATLLNRHLLTFLPSNRFVTAVFIEVDPAGRIRFINAGHPSPIVLDPSGERRQLELGEYEPMGLRDVTYEPLVDQIQRGHVLAMYSDGLSELQDPSGKMLTAMRLGDHLAQLARAAQGQPLQLMADQLKRVLDSYQGGNLQHDDRTYLLARRE